MQKVIYLTCCLLIAIAFFFGLNLGKKIQSIDTPVKTKTIIRKVTVYITLTPRPSKTATPSGMLRVTGKPTLTP